MSSTRLRLAAAVLPVALLLASCGEDAKSPQEAPPTTAAAAAESAELGAVKVEGVEGDRPTLVLPSTPFSTSGPGYRVVKPGTGPQIGAEDSVSAHYMLTNGKDGKQLESRFGKEVVGLSMRDDTLQPAIHKALLGQKVGAQVLVAIPAKDAVGDKGRPELGIAAADTLVYFFEVKGTKTPLTQATGTPVPPKPGLPTVKMGKTSKDPATFTLPKGGKPPADTVIQPLIQGKGPKVAPGQTVRVTYTGVTWRDPAKPFDHSGKTPQGYAEFPVGKGGLIKAWDKGLPGQAVGSRLLVIVPPKDGYGTQGREPDIKGTDTLVFVIDILDAN